MGTALDTALPKYDIRAAHAIVVAALPARTMWAVRAVTLADMPLVRALFALRALPARRDGGICPAQAPAAAAPFWDLLRRRGFAPLGDTPDELVLGAAGRFWVLWGAPLVPLADAGAFRSFDRPGYARAAIAVRVACPGSRDYPNLHAVLCQARYAQGKGDRGRRVPLDRACGSGRV